MCNDGGYRDFRLFRRFIADQYLKLITQVPDDVVIEFISCDPYIAGIDEAADWILAGKVSKYARCAGVSGIRLNMGMSYFGAHHVRSPDQVDEALAGLVEATMLTH